MNSNINQNRSAWVRNQVLEMIAGAGKGHIGGSFSATDLLVALYHNRLLNYDATNPEWELRDRFIMSKGHSVEALYAVLADVGFFEVELLATYGHQDSSLGSHPDRNIPGIELSTGSLGHGLGVATGLALAAKMDGAKHLAVTLMGDGECYEGSVWESAMFAAEHELDNLVAIVDRNRQITLGFTEDVIKLEPFADKWEAFGWKVVEMDGHDISQITRAWQTGRNSQSKQPVVLIADTIKAKGVSFMEADLIWHHNVPKGDQLQAARKELSYRG